MADLQKYRPVTQTTLARMKAVCDAGLQYAEEMIGQDLTDWDVVCALKEDLDQVFDDEAGWGGLGPLYQRDDVSPAVHPLFPR